MAGGLRRRLREGSVRVVLGLRVWRLRASVPGRAGFGALSRNRYGRSVLWGVVDSGGFGFAGRDRLFCAPLVAEGGHVAKAVANYLRDEHTGLLQ